MSAITFGPQGYLTPPLGGADVPASVGVAGNILTRTSGVGPNGLPATIWSNSSAWVPTGTTANMPDGTGAIVSTLPSGVSVPAATLSAAIDSLGTPVAGNFAYRGASSWVLLAPPSSVTAPLVSYGSAPQWAALSALLDTMAASPTQGSIAYRDASVWKALAPGAAGQVLSSGGAGANPSWVTTSLASRPSTDTHTLLEYRFNEGPYSGSALPVALKNRGAYGTSNYSTCPPSTLSGFTMPASGSTTTSTVASSTGWAVGQLVNIATAGYMYITNVSGTTLTLKNLGITGNASSSTVIASGVAIAPCVDLLNFGVGVGVRSLGKIDYAYGFNGTDNASVSNYNTPSSGGSGAFPSITQFTVHALVYPIGYPGKQGHLLGYSHAQTWASAFNDFRLFLENTGDGKWGVYFNNQSFSSITPYAGQYGWVTPNEWQLLSATVDLTITTSSVNLYRNGVLVGTSSTSATATLAFGSAGYWYVGNPNLTGGDTGDGLSGKLGWTAFENTIRSQSYIAGLWASIAPEASGWPVS